MRLDTAVVLAGGLASRLRPISDTIPKALIEVGGKPLLQWILEWLHSNEIRHVVIGVAHLKDKVTSYFGDGSRFGLDITYSVHTVEGGTSEGFLLAIRRYVDRQTFFALNGDQITDLKLSELASFHRKHQRIATIAVSNPRCPFGHLVMDKMQNIVDFVEKPHCLHASCNTGIYVFDREIQRYLSERGDIERDTFPVLAREGNLKGYLFDGFFVTINTTKDLLEAETALRGRFAI